MTDENNDDGTIRDELNTIMPGSDPLQNLDVEQTGPVHYSVLSARNGTVTVHRVDIQNIECSCADMTYNTGATSTDNEGREVCAHIVAAMLAHPQLDVDGMAFYDALGLSQQTHRLVADLREERDAVEETLIEMRDGQAGGAAATDADTTDSDDSSGGAGDSPPGGMTEQDVARAAGDLQTAFDDVIDDMQVTNNDGLVWFQTGQDTPDDWPFPGGDETFKVVTSPDSVMYVHDGSDDWADGPHKHYESKPGEWWKNALDPQEVDDYISEVLE